MYEKLLIFKQEIEEIVGRKQEQTALWSSYSEIVKDKKKESIVIVKPKIEQESAVTKKLVKEKVYKKLSGRNNKNQKGW